MDCVGVKDGQGADEPVPDDEAGLRALNRTRTHPALLHLLRHLTEHPIENLMREFD